MSPFFFWKILFACLIFSSSVFSWELTRWEAETIGKRIYANECGTKVEKLVWWNEGENFASLGIGHFIWYPAGKKGPFEETFPSLLAFLKDSGVELPAWLKTNACCPWNSKEEFLSKAQEAKKKELQGLLTQTIPLQAMFIAKRFEQARDEILATANEKQKAHIRKQIETLGQSLQGKYALLDFLNFKGRGIAGSETYQGEGWGLKQVLEKMPDNADDPLSSFVEIAGSLMKRRVQNAPPDRNEERWLAGWLARINTYHLKS